MDIVDIDKVLDDLELNEDQHSNLIKSTEYNEVATPNQNDRYNKFNSNATGPSGQFNEYHQPIRQQQLQQQSQLQSIPKYPQVQKSHYTQPMLPSVVPTPMTTFDSYGPSAPAIGSTSSATPPIPNRLTKNNFVNVSNVFHSLNEYVNAGLDAGIISEHPSNAYANFENANSINNSDATVGRYQNIENNSTSLSLDNAKDCSIEKYTKLDGLAVPDSNEKSIKNDRCVVSSSIETSVTTTSTSATDEFSNSNFTGSDEVNLLPNDYKIQCTKQLPPISIEKVSSTLRLHEQEPSSHYIQEQRVDQTNAVSTIDETNGGNSFEESISITANTAASNSSSSILPSTSLLSSNNDFSIVQQTSSATVSSTIPAMSSDGSENFGKFSKMELRFEIEGNDSDEKSEQIAEALDGTDRCDIEDDIEKSNLSSDDEAEDKLQANLELDREGIEINKINIDGCKESLIQQSIVGAAPETGTKSIDRFIKPISFEAAATMDDVSDTELESYLQELEELEEASPNQPPDGIICKNTASVSPVKSVIASITTITTDRSSLIDRDEFDSNNDNTEHDNEMNRSLQRDDRNADSFSQASTVEFADINADSDFQPSTTFNTTAANNEKMANFDSNSLSNLEPDQAEEENNCDSIENSDNNDEDGKLEPANKDVIANAVESKESVPASSVSSNVAQPPPNASEAEAAVTPKRPNTLELATVFNLARNVSAGSTPALAGQALSSLISVSSSEDSNIILADSLTRSDDETQSPIEDGNEHATPDIESPSNPNVTSPINSPTRPATTTNASNSANISIYNIGKVQPYWIPDNMTLFCMQCNQKFSFIKRRHHCRACGLVLCSACCSLKAKLEYMGDVEARICLQCDILLNNHSNTAQLPSQQQQSGDSDNDRDVAAAGTDVASVIDANSPFNGEISSPTTATRSPNPNNPMEYCSVIPPHQQVASSSSTTPISVMVPVGVLKREGATPKTQRKEKNVMFSDGIRPGCDLTDLDNSWDTRSSSDGNGNYRKCGNRRVQTPPGNRESPSPAPDQKTPTAKQKINSIKLPVIDPKTNSYIPPSSPSSGKSKDAIVTDTLLPPICISTRTEFKYTEVANNAQLIERLQREELKFMIQRNFYVLVKIVKLTCCINKLVINFTTQGMHHVGQDEIVILLELDASNQLPKDIFLHLNDIFRDADKGQTITELGFSMANTTPFLGSKEHGGFLFIRTTFQCLQNVIVPESPYLIGILIHRWEVPWAKIFPLRLMLRLGALHRYYPSPHVSVRGRNSVYAEIAQTIINFLADFRTYSYTIATIRGMYIHMEDRRTNVLIPKNRYDQIMKALNNSSDHILALAGNFSRMADGHLVCVQNTESGCAETHAYSTQAINIQGKPRKVTGASFLVLNGALKTTSGLSGKCSIVEDGLMVQILPKKMAAIQQALKTMKDIDIVCGPVDADESQTELVSIQWVANDTEFNIGVISPIDKKPMDGIPSIRVHHGLDFSNSNHIIRWTEVFILKSDDESAHGKDPIDMSKLSEQIARSASVALVTFLDLLAANGLIKLAIRATLDQDQVCYEAGCNYDKLAPLYMNALDNELIPTLHRQATNLQLDQTIIVELIFHILDV